MLLSGGWDGTHSAGGKRWFWVRIYCEHPRLWDILPGQGHCCQLGRMPLSCWSECRLLRDSASGKVLLVASTGRRIWPRHSGLLPLWNYPAAVSPIMYDGIFGQMRRWWLSLCYNPCPGFLQACRLWVTVCLFTKCTQMIPIQSNAITDSGVWISGFVCRAETSSCTICVSSHPLLRKPVRYLSLSTWPIALAQWPDSVVAFTM